MPDQDMLEVNRQMIAQFRATRDATGNPMNGRPMLLLTTTGAKSGESRTSPMMALRAGDQLLVVAANAGAPVHPSWYHNILAHPDVTVEVGPEIYGATATIAQGAERDRLWQAIIEQAPFFADYQAQVQRQIPIVILERQDKTGSPI